MRRENPGTPQCIPVVEHLLEMTPAESFCVRLCAYIALHVGTAVSQRKIQRVPLDFALHKAQRALIICIDRIIQRNRV